MSILRAIIVPHPPLIIPTAGRGQEKQVQATVDAYRDAAKQAAALDHGTFVPLYFLRETGVNCPILRVGLSGFSSMEHYQPGQRIA